jgi:murein DD-endopeptidase MepM/ murein hydrolase activator NlpD
MGSGDYEAPRKGSKGRYQHRGLDIFGVEGVSPIYASLGGQVTQSEYQSGAGNLITITSQIGQTSIRAIYMHNAENLVRVGQTVQTGQRIGTVGRTGSVAGQIPSSEAHVHLEVYVNGKRVNPAKRFLNGACPGWGPDKW